MKLGELLLEIEPLLEQMIDDHDLQKSDVLSLISGWIDVHRPSCIEKYLDGSSPVLYTNKSTINKLRKKKVLF